MIEMLVMVDGREERLASEATLRSMGWALLDRRASGAEGAWLEEDGIPVHLEQARGLFVGQWMGVTETRLLDALRPYVLD